VDSAGTIRWQTNGVLLSDSTLNAFGVAISTDTKGGAIVNWNYADGSGGVQRIDKAGKVLWVSNGVLLILSGSGGARRNTSDGLGGVFIGSGLNIHHLDSLGNKLWGANGVPYYDTLGTTNSRQVLDGAQGILNFTEAYRSDGAFIIAQWIDCTGKVRFGAKGAKMTPGVATGDQNWPDATADGRGGAIACWTDYRSQYQVVYAARIDTTGIVTIVTSGEQGIPSSPLLKQNYPNPFNPTTTIRYHVRQRVYVKITVFNILGQELRVLVDQEKEAGEYSVEFDAQRLPAGIYVYQMQIVERNGEIWSESRKMILAK